MIFSLCIRRDGFRTRTAATGSRRRTARFPQSCSIPSASDNLPPTEEASLTRRRGRMAQVVRAWRTSRLVRFLFLIILLGTAAQLLMSQQQQQQTKNIGNARLVSITPLPPDADVEMCEMVPAT